MFIQGRAGLISGPEIHEKIELFRRSSSTKTLVAWSRGYESFNPTRLILAGCILGIGFAFPFRFLFTWARLLFVVRDTSEGHKRVLGGCSSPTLIKVVSFVSLTAFSFSLSTGRPPPPPNPPRGKNLRKLNYFGSIQKAIRKTICENKYMTKQQKDDNGVCGCANWRKIDSRQFVKMLSTNSEI